MKREILKTLSERDLLIGLITSDKFCNEIIPILNPRHLEIDYSRLISSWVKDYYKKYNVSPKQDILKLFRAHSDEIADDSLRENVLSFIKKICDNFDSQKPFNVEYSIDQSIKYLKKRSLQNFSEDIESNLVTGDISKAETIITKYRKVQRATGDGVSLLGDSSVVLDAYTEEESKLFSMKGAFGKLVGDINREDFIAFLAPMKAGKTFQLIDVGIEALKSGLNVVMYSLEMSRNAMIKRAWRALSGQVIEDTELNIPYFVEGDVGELLNIELKKSVKKASSLLDIEKKQASLKRLFRGGEFKIFAEPAYSLTVESLDNKLDDLVNEGFIPDVIIIDYADIMLPSDRSSELRNQIDGIWKRLRAMAQKRKAVVFTASQTNRGALSKEVEATDIAEDIRKLAHVTSMVSISKPDWCKHNNLAVYSQLVVREGAQELRKVVATQCLALCRPVLDSRWYDEVDTKKLTSQCRSTQTEDEEEKYTKKKRGGKSYD